MRGSVKVRLHLFGRFRFIAGDGTDIAPKSAKAQALIALLATSDTAGRGRLWLQKRLWSTSDPDHAGVSLRQALSEIRRYLGDYRDLLISDRRSVSLKISAIELVPAIDHDEFMEGLGLAEGTHDIGDWLEHHRKQARVSAVSAPAAPHLPSIPARPIVVFSTQGKPGSDLGLIEEIFVDCVARSLRETLSAEVRLSGAQDAPRSAFRVNVQAYRVDGAAVGLRTRVERGESDELVWTGLTSTQLRGAPPVEHLQIVSLGNQLIDALADAMTLGVAEAQDVRDANLLTRLAIRRIFCLRSDALIEADEMLARAEELGAGAMSKAWRAQLRIIQHVERHPGRSENLHEETRLLCRDALELAPQNSMVLAAVANTRLVLDQDVNACMELARRGVSFNPAKPLAWNSLATAKLYAGEIREAHALAVRAQKISSGSPFGHWWDFGRCLTAALMGRQEEAVKLAEAAHALAPEFRPPVRYLAALYAASDRFDDAQRMGERLKELEPEFTFEQMAQDEAYPISPLRWSGLLDSEKLMSLN